MLIFSALIASIMLTALAYYAGSYDDLEPPPLPGEEAPDWW
jgi:hypothetical protein